MISIIANAASKLFSFEIAYILYKLYFGALHEQEGALDAIECLEDVSFIHLIKDAKINYSIIQKRLDDYIIKYPNIAA